MVSGAHEVYEWSLVHMGSAETPRWHVCVNACYLAHMVAVRRNVYKTHAGHQLVDTFNFLSFMFSFS